MRVLTPQTAAVSETSRSKAMLRRHRVSAERGFRSAELKTRPLELSDLRRFVAGADVFSRQSDGTTVAIVKSSRPQRSETDRRQDHPGMSSRGLHRCWGRKFRLPLFPDHWAVRAAWSELLVDLNREW